MKKISKLFIITFISFGLCFHVNAEENVCVTHGGNYRMIEFEDAYYPNNWDTYLYKCKWKDCITKYTSCSLGDNAAEFCYGSASSEYKGFAQGYQSYTKCDDSRIFSCVNASATCVVSEHITQESCSKSEEGKNGCFCRCTLKNGPQAVPENESCTCKKEVDYYVVSERYDISASTPDDGKDYTVESAKDILDTALDAQCTGGDKAEVKNTEYSLQNKVSYQSCKCEPTPFEVKNVREAAFKTKGEDNVTDIYAYCINPSQPPSTDSFYEYFDATKCEDSMKTEECGYSNILIEGYYRANILGKSDKYHPGVIGAAMRLWSAHLENEGFGDSGIGNEDDTTCDCEKDSDGNYTEKGEVCCTRNNKWLTFCLSPDGERINVYKETLKYLHESIGYRDSSFSNLYNLETGVDLEIGKLISGSSNNSRGGLRAVACSSDRIGPLCSYEHIDKSLERNHYFYALLLYINTYQGNDKMQEHLDVINGIEPIEPEISEESEESDDGIIDVSMYPVDYVANIVSDNKIKIRYELRKGIKIDCNKLDSKTKDKCEVSQSYIVKDKDGNEIKFEKDYYDYCEKEFCYTVLEFNEEIDCDVIDKIIVKAPFVSDDCGSKSIKRYYACSNFSSHQILYSIEPDKDCENNTSTTPTEKEQKLVCNLCPDKGSFIDNDCEETDDPYKPTVNSQSDPSLNCILHKTNSDSGVKSSQKDMYDYSETFFDDDSTDSEIKVTDICKVYCSDKITYTLSGRKKGVLGSFQLKYDLDADSSRDFNSSHSLVSVIEMERNCVSEIFYNNTFDFEFYEDMESTYGFDEKFIERYLADHEDVDDFFDAVKNWQGLFEVLSYKSTLEGHRTEVLNKLIYDLYNCNFYDEETIEDLTESKISKPFDTINANAVVQKLLNNTKDHCKNGKCVSGYFEYTGGSKYIDEEEYVGIGEDNPKLKIDMDVEDVDIIYCNNGDCFEADASGMFVTEDLPDVRDTKGKMSAKKYKIGSIGKIKVPANDYAIITMKATNYVYNNTRYQTENSSGDVQVYKEIDKNKYHTIPQYTFPVSSFAYSTCSNEENSNHIDSEGNAICEVNHSYDIIAYSEFNDYFNKPQLLFSRNDPDDEFVQNLDELNSYTCDYRVSKDGKGDNYFFFRNIDLSNPVPHNRVGSNWDITNPEINAVVNNIIDSADTLYVSDTYLEYSFILDEDAINLIREDNIDSGYFQIPPSEITDDEVIKKINCTQVDGMYLGCQSKFLTEIRRNCSNNRFGIIAEMESCRGGES